MSEVRRAKVRLVADLYAVTTDGVLVPTGETVEVAYPTPKWAVLQDVDGAWVVVAEKCE